MPASKDAALGWGQRYMWLRHHQQPEEDRHDLNIVTVCPLVRPIPLTKLQAMVDTVVRRHEALRTTYHHDVDGDPLQRVHPAAPLPLVVATTEPDGTPMPADVVHRLAATAFDVAAEWPLRACAITTGGVPQRLVLVFNHMSVDRWTGMLIDNELAVLYAAAHGGRRAKLEPVRHQPLDLAAHESSAEAAAGAARALAWWRDELALLPADPMAPRRAPTARAGAREATLTSPALLAASRRVAGRRGLWPSLVHLAAYNAVMAAYTGSTALGQLWFTSNRESNRYADVRTCVFSPQLMRVDCGGDPTFTELLGRVDAGFKRAQQHAYLPYDAVVELQALEGARRGQAVRIGAELNLISEHAKASGTRRTVLIWKPTTSAWASYGADTYVRIHEWRDAVGVALSAHARVMDTDAVERFLRAYERVVLDNDRVGADPRISEIAAAAGFAAPQRKPVLVRGDHVDLDHVAAVLLAHRAVRSAHLSLADGGALVADVVAPPATTPAELRAHVLGHLDDPCAVRCPTWFRVHADAPVPGAWGSRVPEAEGTGDDGGPGRATGAAERVLVDVVRRVNGLGAVDPTLSYPAAGGRVLRVPRVLTLLADLGFRGVGVYELASPLPLRAVAARLVPTGPGPDPSSARPPDPGGPTGEPHPPSTPIPGGLP